MALTPGLNPNLRLVPDEQEAPFSEDADIIIEAAEGPEDTPEIDEDGNILRIDHADGSISISLDGKPIGSTKEERNESWFDNLAEKIDEMELSRISEDLLRGIQNDIDIITIAP